MKDQTIVIARGALRRVDKHYTGYLKTIMAVEILGGAGAALEFLGHKDIADEIFELCKAAGEPGWKIDSLRLVANLNTSREIDA